MCCKPIACILHLYMVWAWFQLQHGQCSLYTRKTTPCFIASNATVVSFSMLPWMALLSMSYYVNNGEIPSPAVLPTLAILGPVPKSISQIVDQVETFLPLCPLNMRRILHQNACIAKLKTRQMALVFLCFNPSTPELKKCILPTFQKAIVWVM